MGLSHIAPVCPMQCVQSLTTLVDKQYEELSSNKVTNDHLKKLKEEQQIDRIKEIYEAFFVFATIWSYGASLDEDKNSFSNQMKSLVNGNLKFPENG
jgi:hypothetical protein